MNWKDLGDVGEAVILSEAMQKGYIVSVPFGDNGRYDLVIDRGNGLERIQIKYYTGNGERIDVSCRYNKGYKPKKYTKEDIDAIIVYDTFTKKSYYIPSALLGKGRNSISLRITNPKKYAGLIKFWAKDFEDW